MSDQPFFNIDEQKTTKLAEKPKEEPFDYTGFQGEAKNQDSNVLTTLAQMAQELKTADAEVERLEEELKKAKENQKYISETKIPKFMDDCGMAHYKTSDGIEIEVSETIRGSIPKTNEPKAFAWLEKNNAGRLIKREFKIEFGKDEDAWANKFQADLAKRKKPLKSSVKKSVHPQTLQAWVRESLEQGVAIPMDVFGVYRQRVASVKLDTAAKKARK